MDLIIQDKGDTLVLAPDGVLDEQGAEKFIDAVTSRTDDQINVIVDGVLLFGIRENGVEALVRAREDVVSKHGKFLLRNINEDIIMFLELTELIYLFEIDNKMLKN